MSPSSSRRELKAGEGVPFLEAAAEEQSKSTALGNRTVDYLVSAAKAAAGPIPILGPAISELADVVVPNQRVERIAKFLEALERRVCDLEDPKTIRDQLGDEAFTDLLEESLRQAGRSLSDERRDYIASLVGNALSTERIQRVEARHLLRILDQVNDIEIIWLRFYREPTLGGDEDFRDRHAEVLDPVVATLGSSQMELDKHALQESYKEHLSQLGLLERRYATDIRTRQPEFDKLSGRQRERGYEITGLGRLFLREIGIGTTG